MNESSAPSEQLIAARALHAKLLAETQVDQQLKQGGEEGLTEFNVLRFLRAEKFDSDSAEQRLKAHAKWRADHFPDGFIKEELIQSELADPKQVFLQGLDNKGRPAIFVIGGRRDKATRNYDVVRKFVCYCMDTSAYAMRGVDSEDPGKLVAIVDMRELTMAKLDATLRKLVFTMLQEHFPERLGCVYLYEPPMVIQGVWWVVSPFVDAVTKSKFRFVHGKRAHEEFRSIMDPKILPKQYGGEGELVPIDQALRQMRERNGD